MRFLHVIASINPETGGPAEALLHLARVHGKLGHDSEVLTLDAPQAPWLSKLPPNTHAVGPATRAYSYTKRLVPWLRANCDRFDLIILHGLWNYTSVGGWLALSGGDTPYLIFAHGMLDPWFRRNYPLKHLAKQTFWLALEGRVLRDADAVLFTAEEERRLARTSFFGHRYRERVVPFGTADVRGDLALQRGAFSEKVPGLAERPFLLFLSRIHEKKGCDLLIRAFARIAGSRPDLDLVIAGPDQSGWRAELERLASSLGVAGRIHWPGMLTGDAKWGAFRSAEAFVLPSHQENFGIVVAEAMACALPVLITDKVNIWREVEASGGGLVGPDTQDGIADLLRRYLELDNGQRDTMAEKARACFLANFEIEAAANELVQLAREVTASHEAA